jgi:radical SAM superfamily enzyme YgiQ (UPF0313 family)
MYATCGFDSATTRWSNLRQGARVAVYPDAAGLAGAQRNSGEIWDENLRDLELDTLREGDLVGITSMTVTIERAERIARQAMKQGAGVVVGGVHATLMPEHTATFAHSVMVGEGYFTWQQLIQDFAAEGVKGLKPLYEDERWADLEGLATITDRVIAMMDENQNYWTPYLEITRGCPRNCDFCTAIRVSGRRMRFRPGRRSG